MAEVPMTPTPVTEADAATAITNRVLSKLGNGMFREVGELVMAQIWLESGRGQSLMNHNWGNITAGKDWLGDFWRPPWFDINAVNALPETTDAQKNKKRRLLDLHDKMVKGLAPQKFRAYSSFLNGIDDYALRLVKDFPTLVKGFLTGDAAKTAEAIRLSSYNPDSDDASTTKSLASLASELSRKGLFARLPNIPKASAPVVVSSPEPSLPPPVSVSSGQPSGSSPAPVPSPDLSSSPIVPGSGELPWLVKGSVGSAVELFRFLAIGGTGVLTEDDINDLVIPYQESHSLKGDGEVGPKTWNKTLDLHNLLRKV